MNEMLLHYIWNFKIFRTFQFSDTQGNAIEILDFGKWNHNAGPDFLMAKIKINGVIWVGNIEIHTKSSDWIFHQHSSDKAFENIILHVVFHDDTEIEFLQQKNIPTLELKNYIAPEVLSNYEKLSNDNHFIACEKIFDSKKIPVGFFEESILKKLDEKSIEIQETLHHHKNNYEAVLFHYLAYAFGLKINAQIFKQLAENIDFSIIQKIQQNATQLEALLFGKAGWLEESQDDQTKIWTQEYQFLKSKFHISDVSFRPKFMRLRPPNFPTIRLSQLANLYHREQNLFSKIIHAPNIKSLIELFIDVKASNYWDTHFNFGKESKVSYEKTITKDFIEIILINAILPIKYCYHKNYNQDIADEITKMYSEIPPEKNSIIKNWIDLGVETSSALETQALLYHYKTFCNEKKCLNCSIGFQLLKA